MKQRPYLGREPSCPILKPEPFALTDVLGGRARARTNATIASRDCSETGGSPDTCGRDEALIRFAIAEALRELGVSVVEAASADEAWQYLTAGGSVDLVFTDHRMPGSMTGGQLATRIRLQYPSLVVIVTSGYFDDRGWSEPIVPKPYNPFETATALAERARNRGL